MATARALPELRFGFVAICLSEKDCSPNGTVTARRLRNLPEETRRYEILRVARRNLENTLRILRFMKARDIPLYRLSASLIPLATHDITAGWPWWEEPELVERATAIGTAARAGGFLLSSHLPEACGLTSDALFGWMRAYLAYHRRLFDMLGLDATAKIVVHVGGAHGDKAEALAVARNNLRRLVEEAPWTRQRLVLENDDRTFTIEDVVVLAEDVGVPVAFDWHHHWCNGHPRIGPEELAGWLQRAFALWRDRPPKVHVSSPRKGPHDRAHADYVDVSFIRPFLDLLADAGADAVDVMVEAKMKDLAMLRLRDELVEDS